MKKNQNIKLLSLVLAIPFSLSLLYQSCRKLQGVEIEASDTDEFVVAAKNWFANSVVENEKIKVSQLGTSSVRDLYQRKFARMEKIRKYIDWNKANIYRQDKIDFVIVPVVSEIKPFKNKNYQAARSLIFYKDKVNNMNMKILEIISQKDEALVNIQSMMLKAFINYYFNDKKEFENTNANVVIYESNYKYEKSFQIKKGTWSQSKTSFVNRQGANVTRRISTMGQRTTCQTCEHWYLVGIWYDLQTGEIVFTQILDEWDDCNNTGIAPYGYGASPTPPEDQECQQMANELESGTASDLENVSGGNLGPTLRGKRYTWTFYKQNFGLWKFASVDSGYHAKINNEWRFQSLIHKKEELSGTWIGGVIACNDVEATATVGLYNARMDLHYQIKADAVCKGSPIGSAEYYDSHRIFNIND